ncbi:hypothetical protein E3N88_28560 [Mikania micrantha]|uniref:Uncharacterized protein n=1 Tax=Mikania micrantha TaxID=192012 RepID=A0A5N6MZT8_9ASTR|nr:hypothetical protein E3N88_28560 [Mikania micrantha]
MPCVEPGTQKWCEGQLGRDWPNGQGTARSNGSWPNGQGRRAPFADQSLIRSLSPFANHSHSLGYEHLIRPGSKPHTVMSHSFTWEAIRPKIKEIPSDLDHLHSANTCAPFIQSAQLLQAHITRQTPMKLIRPTNPVSTQEAVSGPTSTSSTVEDSTQEMVNMGENHARNGVTDCPESRNEEKNRKMDENGLGRHRPRSSRKCDMEAPAAVGQNMSTAKSSTGMSCQLRLIVKEVLWKHEPFDCVSPVQLKKSYACMSYQLRVDSYRVSCCTSLFDFRSAVDGEVPSPYE